MKRTPEEEEELEQLIRAQELDAKNYRSSSGASSLDAPMAARAGVSGRLVDFLDTDGVVALGRWSPRYHCPVHGSGGYVVRPSGRVECGPCDKERLEARRRLVGTKRRPTGPGCVHEESEHRIVSGRVRCRACTNAATRRYYWRKKWKSGQSQSTKGTATDAKFTSPERRSKRSQRCTSAINAIQWPLLFGDDKPEEEG